MNKVVVITGASSGIGLETAKLFAKNGWQVFAGARHTDRVPTDTNIHPLALDLTVQESIETFIKDIFASVSRIDVLINNAGYGESGPAEDISLANIHKQFETNFFGAVELTKLVLPQMRQQGAGRIVNISSVGGDIYSPLASYYHASKAALQQWSDTLDIEVQQFGIRSVIVQPGGTQSAWGNTAINNIKKNLKPNSGYETLAKILSQMLSADAKGMSASSSDLAKVIYAASTDTRPKHRYFNSYRDHMSVIMARAFPVLFRNTLLRSLNNAAKKINN